MADKFSIAIMTKMFQIVKDKMHQNAERGFWAIQQWHVFIEYVNIFVNLDPILKILFSSSQKLNELSISNKKCHD